MTKRMLIDASHADETRVAILDGTLLDDFEAETADKAQLKGNIYIGHVSRVEPSLQAAFITYGGNRNGFLAFGEVHPQFFSLPKGEKAKLLDEMLDQGERRRGHLRDDGHEEESNGNKAEASDSEADGNRESSRDEGRGRDGANRRQPGIYRRYRIQDVLKEGQKILVQVVKEERGSKGAALTTYFSMPGRYTVLMPNTPYAGGISRKISDPDERRQLRDMYAALKIPESMGLIIRTAGLGQEVDNIVKDYDNLRGLWDSIQKNFDDNDDVQCVHEDGSLIIRAIRDMMADDIDEVVISGKRAYKTAKDFAKNLMPDAAKLIKEYKDETPLFAAHKVEQKLNHLHFSRVQLPSGGYMIINPTEALVAVDINSGRNTHERNIEETAVKTNLEACDELGRQIRLRDLAGLIVVDFIDMEDNRNVRKVENVMRKVLRRDRARVQYTNISDFGLMEISRQRLRPSFGESHFITCPHCQGSGHVHAPSTAALMVLRRLEEEDCRGADRIVVTAATPLVLWILNNKRGVVADMEAKYKYHLVFKADDHLIAPDHKLELVHVKADGSESIRAIDVRLREQPDVPPEQRYKSNGERTSGNRDRDERGGDGRRGRDDRGGRGRDRDEGRSDKRAEGSDRSDSRDSGRDSGRDEGRDDNRSRGRGSRDDRGGRGGRGRGRDRDDGNRRPQRVEDDSVAASSSEYSSRASGREERSSRRDERRDERPARAAKAEEPKTDAVVVKVEEILPVAEDQPLAVQKVAYVDDDAPVVVAPRKKVAIRVQEDTDASDEPLKVQKLSVGEEDVEAPLPAKSRAKKGLIGRIIG